MKKITLLFTFLLSTLFCFSQGYQFGIEHISGYNFKIVAIPDFDSAGNTDISDVGFALILPAGTADVVNEVPLLGGGARAWTVQQFDAAFLTSLSLGDGTKDAFQFNVPPGQTILSHTNGQPIDLISFDISNSPIAGVMSILLNTDPIAVGAGGVLDSFYNTDLDGPGGNPTADYFSGLILGLETFDFVVLATDDFEQSITNISLYPNPSSDIFYIKGLQETATIFIYDINGKEILNKKEYLNEAIDVSKFNTGVYMIKIQNKNNNEIKKLIVK